MAGLILLLVGVIVVLVAVLLILVLLVGIVLMLRRRSKASDDDPAERTEIREERPGAKTVPAQPAAMPNSAQKTPAPAPPPNKTPPPASPSGPRKMAPVGGTAPVGFAAPPPPPPFAGGSAGKKTADPQRPGPLIGFFDEESEGAKTEVFNRDMAARYAAMLDDEDEGDHTELFSSTDMDPEVAAILEQEGGTSGVKKAPGRIVAEDKKKK